MFPLPNITQPSATGYPLRMIESIGPNTDKAIDTFGLTDSILPRLHLLVRQTRENKWLRALEGSEYGLEPPAAMALNVALKADLSPRKKKVFSCHSSK
jgi:hypothetical protein